MLKTIVSTHIQKDERVVSVKEKVTEFKRVKRTTVTTVVEIQEKVVGVLECGHICDWIDSVPEVGKKVKCYYCEEL